MNMNKIDKVTVFEKIIVYECSRRIAHYSHGPQSVIRDPWELQDS